MSLTMFNKYIDALPEVIPDVTEKNDCEKENSIEEQLREEQKKTQSLKNECDTLVAEIIEYFTTQDPQSLTQLNRGIITKEDFLKLATVWLQKKGIRAHFIPVVIEMFRKYMWGYYILEDLINDDEISDIKVLSPDNIQIKRLGKRLGTSVKFKDMEDYKRFVQVVATKNQVNISDINAIQNFTDRTNNEKNILRFNISSEFVNSVGNPYLQIRKIPKIKRGLTELIEAGMMDENTAEYLADKAKTSSGIVFCGKGASGKTTLMNALLEHIPKDKAGLVIQENEELFSKKHPNMMFQHVVMANGEGKVEYSLKDLARNGLLIDLDYFIIGEIKGDEALYFLNACSTGHQAWCSVHGNSSTEALFKLADYIKYASDYSQADVLKMLTSLHVVVFLKDYKVVEISEIVGYDAESENLKYKRILRRGERT